MWNLIVNCKAGNWGADIPKPIPSFRLLVLSWPLWTLIVKSKRLVKPGFCWDIHRFPRPQMKNLGSKWKESRTIVANFTYKTCFTTCMSLACRYIDSLSQCAILRHQPETYLSQWSSMSKLCSQQCHLQRLSSGVEIWPAEICWIQTRQGWDKDETRSVDQVDTCSSTLTMLATARVLPGRCWCFQTANTGKEPISRLSRPALLDRIRKVRKGTNQIAWKIHIDHWLVWTLRCRKHSSQLPRNEKVAGMSEDKAVCVIFLAGCRLCFWPCFVPSSRVHWSLHPISKLLGGCERCLSCAPNMRKLSFGDSATLVGNPTTAALAAPTSLSRDIVTSKSKHVWTDLAFMLNLFGLSKYVKNLRGVMQLSFGLVRRHWRQRGLEASPQGTLFLSVLKKTHLAKVTATQNLATWATCAIWSLV